MLMMPEQETSGGVIVRTAKRYSNPYGTHRCSIEFQSGMRHFERPTSSACPGDNARDP